MNLRQVMILSARSMSISAERLLAIAADLERQDRIKPRLSRGEAAPASSAAVPSVRTNNSVSIQIARDILVRTIEMLK